MGATVDWLGEERQDLAVDRILEAAREVLCRDGIAGARMGRIAEAAGCARATLYRYFPNKEALLLAYMARVAQEFEQVLESRLDGIDSLGPRLVEAAATSIELIREREDLAPFFSEEGVGLTAQLTSSAAAMRARLAEQIASESRARAVRGGLRPGVTADEAAEWLTRTIFSFAILPVEPRSGTALRRYLSKMLLPALTKS